MNCWGPTQIIIVSPGKNRWIHLKEALPRIVDWAEERQSLRIPMFWVQEWQLEVESPATPTGPQATVLCRDHLVVSLTGVKAELRSKCSGTNTGGLILISVNCLPNPALCPWLFPSLGCSCPWHLHGSQLYFIYAFALILSIHRHLTFSNVQVCSLFITCFTFIAHLIHCLTLYKCFSCLPPWDASFMRQQHYFVHWYIPHA